MSENIQYRFADKNDIPTIVNLLRNNNLPAGDIDENRIDFLVAINSADKIIGCIGIEKYSEEALLRSFAVDEDYQKKNIGAELLGRLFKISGESGIKTLHLLTTTAETYFKAKGFITSDRNSAPLSIKQTTEFTSLCPASSVYMYNKNISSL
jgi:amino-acid N-acetyltransferase